MQDRLLPGDQTHTTSSPPASAKWRLYFPKVVIRLGVVALLALALQFVATDAPLGSSDIPRRILLVFSYLLLIAFVTANVRRPGILILGAGLLLNFAAIIANGGLMPVTPETMARAHYTIPADVGNGDWVPHTKDVLLVREDVRLWFLGDRLVLAGLPAFRAFSLGDVIIVLGLVVTAGELLLPRVGRAPQGGLPGGRSGTTP
ncbi:MAG: DUF5317 family protein [Dehalococcoidia bacterium]|nr:DUF5317 family protein [Dehalococcoidia bacterium]